jgi:EmrB/QacA subfamily drug resistance transporter
MEEQQSAARGLSARLRELTDAARSRRGLITLAMLLAMTVTALEQTVVSTAMTSIIASLKGLEIFPWVFSAYLLAATVTTPLYGKLADLLGRKRVLLFGLATFGLGSMLSGLAQSMPQLIAARVVQGIGAGAVGPIVITLLGDLFTLAERARVQALFSVVWGVSSLAGPALGGVLTDRLSWRWVFFVTIPFAIVSAWILVTQVDESLEHRDREHLPIDWAGAGLLTAGSSALLLIVLRGEQQTASAGTSLAVLAAFLLALFVWRERRAADPILPLDLLATPHIAAAIVSSFLIGALMFGIDTFIPLFMQGVKGGKATNAGLTITPLFLTWAISVAVAARLVGRLGFRRTAIFGSIFIAAGTFLLVLGATYPALSGPFFFVGLTVTGMGFGPTSLCGILGVQNSVPWGRRGVATAAVMFFRTTGGALGVGLLGAWLSYSLRLHLAATPRIDAAAALLPRTHALLTPESLRTVQKAMGQSIREVFLEMLALAVLLILCSFGLRGGRATSHHDAGSLPERRDSREDKDLTLVAGFEH